MPIIRVDMLAGRTGEEKRALAKALTEACIRTLGSSPDSVKVLLVDVPREHWASGGVLYSDKDAVNPPG